MASTPKQSDGKLPSNNNGSGGKRKKSRGSRGSYLSKWLDRTMSHIQETTPSSEMYDSFVGPTVRDTIWPGSQFSPGYDSYKYNIYGSEPLSLPSLPTYYNPMMPLPPYSDYRVIQNENKGVQVQRPRPRRRSENKAEEVSSTPADATPTSQNNYLQPKNFTDSQDFTSLPPIVTSMADTNSNSDTQNDKDDASQARRFSDPCVGGLPDVAQPANGDIESGSESGSGLSGSQVGGRLLACLLDQISALKMANDRLNKDLQEMRAELDAVRQHNGYFPKGPNSMGPATNINGMGGQYSPGFVTDLVREIRDAARMREEAMYARLRALVLERTDNGLASAEVKLAERTLEEIRSSLRASEADKRRMMDRILKLEDELRVFRLATGFDPNEVRLNGSAEDAECERLRLRKDLADARRAKINAEEHALK
ncbi:uncharacterized protein LOC112058364 isoform X2 [Bicyclus anynana]|nr:uncharacterized protein LOC112058364 isoform X2 [Bicyclus anynana]